MHLIALAAAILAAHDAPEELPSEQQIAAASATLRTARKYCNAAIALGSPSAGVTKRWSNPAQNPPRKRKSIDRLPRKLANARRRLARQTAAE